MVQQYEGVSSGVQGYAICRSVQWHVEEYMDDRWHAGCMVLHSGVLEYCLQGDSWTEKPGIPLEVVHLGLMGRQMSDT